MAERSLKIVYGISGSIAAVKAPELVRALRDKGYDVHCLLTPGAEQFVTSLSLATLSSNPVLSGMFGANAFQMPHLTLAAEADLMLIAPATAALLARCASGMSEDMITLTYLTTTAPIVIAPAMHTTMWEHPATQQNVKLLKERKVTFVGPYQGPLADLSRGEGRMAEPTDIVQMVEQILSKRKK